MKLSTTICFIFFAIILKAQVYENAVYVYHKDGRVSTFLQENIDSINYTRIDASGEMRDTWQAQLIHTKDSLFYLPLENTDSISFEASMYQKNIPYSNEGGIKLPAHSANVEFCFTKKESFRNIKAGRFFSFTSNNKIVVNFTNSKSSDIYCHPYENQFAVGVNGVGGALPSPINHYGQSLFSIRVKYPVVNVVHDNGETEIETYMPEIYQGAYMQKEELLFNIYYGDSTIYKSYNISADTPVDTFVNMLQSDTVLLKDFEIVKYDCEGVVMGEIDDFSYINLTSLIDEIYFTQSSTTPQKTGNTYWDSYPVILKKSDKGYKHRLKMSYRVVDNMVTHVQISIDGKYLKYDNVSLPAQNLCLTAIESVVDSISSLSITPYKQTSTPLISMQHTVKVSDKYLGISMQTSTKRQREVLEYLKLKGFKSLNYGEFISCMKGEKDFDCPTYCLTYDDYQHDMWRNDEIRNMFNEYNAKPTLVYLFTSQNLSSDDIPQNVLTREEYEDMKAAGWDVISHGFCMFTSHLSYAQFKWGFEMLRKRWYDWYGVDMKSYNPHGYELLDHQYYLLKCMGWENMSSGTATQGWFCEYNTPLDIQYKRVGWMDGDQDWEKVKTNIDKYCE